MSPLNDYSVPNGHYHKNNNNNKAIHATVNELIRLYFIYAHVYIYYIYMDFKGSGRSYGRVWKMEREGQKDN